MSARRAASTHADPSAAAQRASRGRAGPRGAASSHSAPTSAKRAQSNRGDRALLLDTHVWVWLLAGEDTQMSAALPAQMERASDIGECYVSDISAWEVATKSARHALPLSMDATAWTDEAASAPGLNYIAVSREILVASARLPVDALPDLADRILVATALRHGLTVVTADQSLLSFQISWPLFRILDARP